MRDPKQWNDFINKEDKNFQSCPFFHKKIKSKLTEIENGIDSF